MTEDWLSTYFSGSDPGFLPPLHPSGTDFQLLVWKELLTIAYGTTTTYGHLADRIASSNGHRASARAVGRAIGSNRILLLIPCHRVIGSDGSLTGYAGGVKRKASLLALEKAGTGTSKRWSSAIKKCDRSHGTRYTGIVRYPQRSNPFIRNEAR